MRRTHPQPSVTRSGTALEPWELFDQRSGRSLGTFPTCSDARDRCRSIWPDYTFRWTYNMDGEAIGNTESVKVRL